LDSTQKLQYKLKNIYSQDLLWINVSALLWINISVNSKELNSWLFSLIHKVSNKQKALMYVYNLVH